MARPTGIEPVTSSFGKPPSPSVAPFVTTY